MPSRAALNVPGNTSEAYFFLNDQYVRIKWTPGTTDDSITYGPAGIADEWPGLHGAGFVRVDAILPVPGVSDEAYFFSGTQYLRAKITRGAPDIVVFGPTNIADHWPSLEKAGFKTIDAAFPSPAGGGESYFFSGNRYVRIKVVPGSQDDTITYGPRKIVEEWPTLKAAGFVTLDAALPSPNGGGETYVLSGTQYVLIKVIHGGPETLLTGPKSVASYWPSLKQAGFY